MDLRATFVRASTLSAIINLCCFNILFQFSSSHQRLLWQLSVLECVEVAVEMTSHLVFNEPGKWGVVILLQLVK